MRSKIEHGTKVDPAVEWTATGPKRRPVYRHSLLQSYSLKTAVCFCLIAKEMSDNDRNVGACANMNSINIYLGRLLLNRD